MPVIEIPCPRFVRYDGDLCEDEAGHTCDFVVFDEEGSPGACWRCLKYLLPTPYGPDRAVELGKAGFTDGKVIPKRCIHCRKEYP